MRIWLWCYRPRARAPAPNRETNLLFKHFTIKRAKRAENILLAAGEKNTFLKPRNSVRTFKIRFSKGHWSGKTPDPIVEKQGGPCGCYEIDWKIVTNKQCFIIIMWNTSYHSPPKGGKNSKILWHSKILRARARPRTLSPDGNITIKCAYPKCRTGRISKVQLLKLAHWVRTDIKPSYLGAQEELDNILGHF